MTPREPTVATLPAAILRLRKQKFGSQVKFAEAIGVTDRTVKRWEAGEQVPTGDPRAKLISEGIPERLFLSAEVLEDASARLLRVEAETAQIRELLAGLEPDEAPPPRERGRRPRP